jgi:RNA polymerase sigma-70 factor (ECF subfamily)
MRDRQCRQIFAALSDYVDGELPVKSCRELERHLEGCKPCIAFLESLKTTVEACRRYGQNEKLSLPPQLPPEMRARLVTWLRPESMRGKAPAWRKSGQGLQRSKP